MPHALHFLIYTAAGWLNRRQEDLIDYLREENRVLREQLGGRPLRLTDAQRRRLAIRGQKLGRRVLSRVAGIVTPDTILRWYRRLIAQKYDGSARRRRGRPLTPQAIGELVVRMAIENPRWGYTRIRGALANLGHEIGRNTVKRILLSRGMAPAPERGQRTPWKTFLQAHWDGLAATDLFTVEVLTLEGLKRYLVLFVIELRTRYVHVVGIHPQPDGAWMEQMARNLTDPGEGFLRTSRYLLHDRDPLYTDDFEEILRSSGVSPVRLPARSPNLNAYAERFVRSIKEECLSRVVPLGEGHLRQLVHEYVEHYHWERNHQGLQNQLLRRPPPPVRPASRVARRTAQLLPSRGRVTVRPINGTLRGPNNDRWGTRLRQLRPTGGTPANAINLSGTEPPIAKRRLRGVMPCVQSSRSSTRSCSGPSLGPSPSGQDYVRSVDGSAARRRRCRSRCASRWGTPPSRHDWQYRR